MLTLRRTLWTGSRKRQQVEQVEENWVIFNYNLLGSGWASLGCVSLSYLPELSVSCLASWSTSGLPAYRTQPGPSRFPHVHPPTTPSTHPPLHPPSHPPLHPPSHHSEPPLCFLSQKLPGLLAQHLGAPRTSQPPLYNQGIVGYWRKKGTLM